MKTAYWARFFKEPDGKYSVDIPDLPGCLSYGPSVEEAYRRLVEEAIPEWLEDQAWPEAREADEVMALPTLVKVPPLLVRVSHNDVGGFSSNIFHHSVWADADVGDSWQQWGKH
jgi:predicted RNase H-like HicB family nuclease